MQTQRVAVVGAGWAGIAAALQLSEEGFAVTLFDTARTAGGRARAVDWITSDGETVTLDCGQHILIGAYRATLGLMDKLGLDTGQLLRRLPFGISSTSGLKLRLLRLPSPFHLLIGLICAKGLSFRDRLSMAWLVQRTKMANWHIGNDVTVATWLTAAKQSSTAQTLFWFPLCVAALNTPAQSASAQVFVNVLRDSVGGRAADSDFLLAPGALNTVLTDAAIVSLRRTGRVALGTRILGVDVGAHGLKVRHDDEIEIFEGVVCAVPAHQLSHLLEPGQSAEIAALLNRTAQFTWQPITTVYLRFSTQQRLPAMMVALDENVGLARYGQWLFDREAMGGPRGLLSVVISAEGPHLGLSHEALAASVLAQLQNEGLVSSTACETRVFTEKRATFACTPNLQRPDNRISGLPLVIAGDYTASDYPATLEGAVRSGLRAAGMLAANLRLAGAA